MHICFDCFELWECGYLLYNFQGIHTLRNHADPAGIMAEAKGEDVVCIGASFIGEDLGRVANLFMNNWLETVTSFLARVYTGTSFQRNTEEEQY